MKKRTGRPPRQDKPQKLTLSLSLRAYKKLERLSKFSPSRSAMVERLIMEAMMEDAA
jgi:hypothetical protein